jgi:hypothetical protein
MKPPTCETCAHWKRESWMPEPLGTCGRVESEDNMDRISAQRDAFGISADGGASLFTGPDFGCVQHTPKD